MAWRMFRKHIGTGTNMINSHIPIMTTKYIESLGVWSTAAFWIPDGCSEDDPASVIREERDGKTPEESFNAVVKCLREKGKME